MGLAQGTDSCRGCLGDPRYAERKGRGKHASDQGTSHILLNFLVSAADSPDADLATMTAAARRHNQAEPGGNTPSGASSARHPSDCADYPASDAVKAIQRPRRARRRRAGRPSQLAAAKALGVPQSVIAKLELGKRQLLFLEALRLAGLYGVDCRELGPKGSENDGRL